MTEDVFPETELIQTTQSDRDEAAEAIREAEALADDIRTHDRKMQADFVKLGSVLLRIRNEKHWITAGYKSWGAYIKSIGERIGKGRTQLFLTVSVVENLLPNVAEEDLTDIGITKSAALSQFSKTTGRLPPEELIEKAKDPAVSADEFRAAVNTEGRIFPDEKGKWMELAFYATPDERKEIEEAIEAAKRMEQIPITLPDHERLKLGILCMAREFVGTYGDGTGSPATGQEG